MSDIQRYKILLFSLSMIVLVLFVSSLLIGPAALGVSDSLHALFTGQGDAVTLVMREIRLPRAILGLLVGAALGLSGAVLQGYLRNPLAEPALLGVSASASLGAVIAIYTGLSALFPFTLPLMALIGAFVSVFIVQMLAGKHSGTLTVILAGVAISSLAAAMTSLALNLSPNPFAATEIVFWLLGSLADRSMMHVMLTAPFIVVGAFLLLTLGRSLDALTLGTETAMSMGVNLRKLQILVITGTAATVGAATAVAGAIGFIGLIVPHILRPFVGAHPSRLLPVSALGGAAVLLLADIAVRIIAPSRDLKLGVLTALVGAPFFLWLVLRYRKKLL